MPTERSAPMTMWAMSWHTPVRSVHEWAAKASTVVEPETYLTSR